MRCFSGLLLFVVLLANRDSALAQDTCGAGQTAGCGTCRDCSLDPGSVFGNSDLTGLTWETHSIEPDSLWDNLTIFGGLEGSKQPQDYGVNAHLGGRVSANLGLPLCQHIGLGLQVGTSIAYTDNAVQVYERFGEARGRSQSFTTIGLFQRLDNGLVWGAAWDYLHQNYYDQTNLHQARGRIGWRTGTEEIGIRAQVSHSSDRAFFLGAIPVVLEPVSQGALYWTHEWENDARTTFWLGIAESHGERNLAFEVLLTDPNQRPSGQRLLFGAEIDVPLSDYWSLFGQANFITPAYTGTVDSYLGFAFYPGGGARRSRTNRYAPVQPVASSTSMSIDLR